jgi:hypothetical protein
VTFANAEQAPVSTFVIEDELHAELHGEFETLDAALAELRRRAALPWDKPPNLAPCTSWRTGGRHYIVREYDDGSPPGLVRSVDVLNVSASGPQWTPTPSSESEDGADALTRAWFADLGFELEIHAGDGQTWVNLRRGSFTAPRYGVGRDRATALKLAQERYRDEQGSHGA